MIVLSLVNHSLSNVPELNRYLFILINNNISDEIYVLVNKVLKLYHSSFNQLNSCVLFSCGYVIIILMHDIPVPIYATCVAYITIAAASALHQAECFFDMQPMSLKL
uniref:Uncharacterized protein n=1 Tax=Octopus bimaculoides TaxID=37653 RepID=A0A0L8GIV7_OCTBM